MLETAQGESHQWRDVENDIDGFCEGHLHLEKLHAADGIVDDYLQKNHEAAEQQGAQEEDQVTPPVPTVLEGVFSNYCKSLGEHGRSISNSEFICWRPRHRDRVWEDGARFNSFSPVLTDLTARPSRRRTDARRLIRGGVYRRKVRPPSEV